MSRKTRNLLVTAIAVVVAAAAFIIVRSIEPEAEPVERPETAKRTVLSDNTYTNLRSVRVDNDKGGYHFYSENGNDWQIADVPAHYELDDAGAVTAVRLFASIGGQEVEEDADAGRLAEFGLDDPEAVVTLRDAEGGIVILEFGSMNPSGSGRFARIAGSTSVALVSAHAARAAAAGIDDYRNMSLPTVNLEALAGFSYTSGDTVFIAEPRQDTDPFVSHAGPFDVVSPYRGRYVMDDYTLSKVLMETSPLPVQVRGWLDDADPADPALGLIDGEADSIRIFDTEGGALMLRVGAGDGEGNRYAILTDRESAVFLVSEGDVGILETEPFELVSKFMFLANIVDVAQVKVETDDGTWVMRREGMGEEDNSKDDKFYIGDLPLEHEDFSSVYQKFIGLMWEGEITERKSIEYPVLRITVSHEVPGVENRIIRFWEYDDTYYQATVGDNPLEFLVGRYQVGLFLEELKVLSEFAS